MNNVKARRAMTILNCDSKKFALSQNGINVLRRWLQDTLTSGLSALAGQPYSFWDQIAAQATDAYLPEIARRLRLMFDLTNSGEGWQGRLLEELTHLHIICQAFDQAEALGPLQADLFAAVGWLAPDSAKGAALPAPVYPDPQMAVADRWLVIGQVSTPEVPTDIELTSGWAERQEVRVYSTWLWGLASQRLAMVQARSWATQPLLWGPGHLLEGRLTYYPSAFPLQGVLKELAIEKPAMAKQPRPFSDTAQLEATAYPSLDSAFAGYANALACNPFLQVFPMLLRDLVPVRLPGKEGGQWALQHRLSGGQIPTFLSASQHGWELLAVSGGQAITCFGLWTGAAFIPCSLISENRFVELSSGQHKRNPLTF
jgi:hypothetical protein